jgi:hypothetical protein
MANNGFATVPSMSVISVLAAATFPVPCDGDDFTSSGTESHQNSSEEPAQSMDAPDSSTTPPWGWTPESFGFAVAFGPAAILSRRWGEDRPFHDPIDFPGRGAPGSAAAGDDEYVGPNFAAVLG